MSRWRICACVCLLRCKECDSVEKLLVVEGRYLLQSELRAVQCYTVRKSTETITLLQNELKKQLLQDYLGYNPKRMYESYVETTNIHIATLDA